MKKIASWAVALLIVTLFSSNAYADYLTLTRNANIYKEPNSDSKRIDYVTMSDSAVPMNFRLVSSELKNGYFNIHLPDQRGKGWIYKSRVRLKLGDFPQKSISSNLSHAFEPLKGDQMRAHFLNVGQGDATIFEFSCGIVLVDLGGEKNALFDSHEETWTYINAIFERRPDLNHTFDAFYITHPHIDHTRQARKLLDSNQLFVRNYVDNGQRSGSGGPQQRAWQDNVSSNDTIGYQSVHLKDIPIETGLTNEFIDPVNCSRFEDPVIKVLWGQVESDPGWGKHFGKLRFNNSNNHSVVVRVDFGKSSFLLTGDLEDVAIHDFVERYKNSDLLDVDVYQAGHHGSVNGTTVDLVKKMSPEVAVISVGQPERQLDWTAWKFGHPRQEIVAMLDDDSNGVSFTRKPVSVNVGLKSTKFIEQSVDSAIYSTAWDGTVVIQANKSGQLLVLTER